MRDRFDFYAKEIAEKLSCIECFDFYGYKPDRSGYVCCPFHSEKTGSLKVWKDHWKCFGCGEHGDNISLVRKLFDLNFTDAIKKLNEDFKLGIDIEKPRFSDFKRFENQMKRARKERQEAELRRQKELEEYRELADAECGLKMIVKRMAPKSANETPDPVWIAAAQWLPYISFLLDSFELEGGPAG